jgi:hypothetical protein
MSLFHVVHRSVRRRTRFTVCRRAPPSPVFSNPMESGMAAPAPVHRRGLALLCPIAAAAIGAGFGCRTALLHDPGRAAAVDAAATVEQRPAPQTLPLEIVFVRYEPHEALLHEELWNFVDEQALGPETRRRLNANGLRAGVVAGTLPPTIAERFAAPSGAEPALGETGGVRKLLRLLPGRHAEVVAAAALPELVLIEEGADGVRGGTYRDATTLVAVEARPAADGGVRVEAVPEVKHGPVMRSWVGEEGLFRLEAGQRRHRLEHLQIAATLRPQSLLVIGCAGDATSTVGEALLRDRAGGSLRLLVLRPLATAIDPLFATPSTAGDEPD